MIPSPGWRAEGQALTRKDSDLAPDPLGYVDLTIRVYPEADQYVGEVIELGVASCGETVEEAANNAIEATELYLNDIEDTGERERVFGERGVEIHPGLPPGEDTSRTVTTRPREYVTTKTIPIPTGT